MDGTVIALKRAGEITVDEVWLQRRLRDGNHNHHLIDVGDDDVFPPARGACEQSMSWLDPFDEPFVIQRRANPHAVPGSDDVAFIGDERLEQPPHGTAVFTAVVVFPTPPFWLTTAIVRLKSVSRQTHRSSCWADVSRGTPYTALTSTATVITQISVALANPGRGQRSSA